MRICSFAALLAIGGLLTVYPVRAAQHTGRSVRETPPVKLEVTGLSIIPAQPEPGQPVTVKLTIKNAGAGSVAKVPWSIHHAPGNQTLASGEQQNVTAGSSFEATATWTAKAGAQKLQGYVDPKGTLKNTAPSASQVKDLNITGPQVPAARAGPPLARSRDLAGPSFVGSPLLRSRELPGPSFVGSPLLRSRELAGPSFVGSPQP